MKQTGRVCQVIMMMCMMCWSSLTINQHIAQGPGAGAVAESGGAEHAADCRGG